MRRTDPCNPHVKDEHPGFIGLPPPSRSGGDSGASRHPSHVGSLRRARREILAPPELDSAHLGCSRRRPRASGHRSTEPASTVGHVNADGLPRARAPSTNRKPIPGPFRAPTLSTSVSVSFRPWATTAFELGPDPNLGLLAGFGAGHRQLASATTMKPEHTKWTSNPSPGNAAGTFRAATTTSLPR